MIGLKNWVMSVAAGIALASCTTAATSPTDAAPNGQLSFGAELPLIARSCIQAVTRTGDAVAAFQSRGYKVSSTGAGQTTLRLERPGSGLRQTKYIKIAISQTRASTECAASFSGQVGFSLYRDYLTEIERLGFVREAGDGNKPYVRGNQQFKARGKGRGSSDDATFTLFNDT